MFGNYFVFYKAIKKLFLRFHGSTKNDSLPDPELYRNWGRFSEHAKSVLIERDHLSQIAGINLSQIHKLNEAGIKTLEDLTKTDKKIETLDRRVFERLKQQAEMQSQAKTSGVIPFEVLKDMEQGLGLYSLPPKSDLDIYFDIESNPLLTKIPLHYLWGAAHEDNEEGFDCWWAHSEEEMKLAFEAFMDWTYSRWKKDKGMHVYHYGQFENNGHEDANGAFWHQRKRS